MNKALEQMRANEESQSVISLKPLRDIEHLPVNGQMAPSLLERRKQLKNKEIVDFPTLPSGNSTFNEF